MRRRIRRPWRLAWIVCAGALCFSAPGEEAEAPAAEQGQAAPAAEKRQEKQQQEPQEQDDRQQTAESDEDADDADADTAEEVFVPSEAISEDKAVPFPSDI